MESTRSVGCNHFEEMYVIHRRWYVINPKKETYKAHALMTYRLRCKRITYSLREITYQSFGLDKKRTKISLRSFFEGANQI